MEDKNLYYQYSGKVNLKGIFLLIITTIFLSVVLGGVYISGVILSNFIFKIFKSSSFIVGATKFVVNAFVYFTIVFVLSGILGNIIGKISKQGKLRNFKWILITSILGGLIYRSIYIFGFNYYTDEIFSFSPTATYQNYIIQTKLFMWIWWCLLNSVVVASIYITARDILTKDTFCEKCEVWAEGKKRILVEDISRIGILKLKEEIREKNFEKLKEIEKIDFSKEKYTEILIQFCEECKSEYYLSINNYSTEIKENGNNKEIKEVIFDKLILTKEEAENLKNWENKK